MVYNATQLEMIPKTYNNLWDPILRLLLFHTTHFQLNFDMKILLASIIFCIFPSALRIIFKVIIPLKQAAKLHIFIRPSVAR